MAASNTEQMPPWPRHGPVEGCVDEPGLETRGAHQGQCVGDGGHGLTEPGPEPKRAVVRRQQWRCTVKKAFLF